MDIFSVELWSFGASRRSFYLFLLIYIYIYVYIPYIYQKKEKKDLLDAPKDKNSTKNAHNAFDTKWLEQRPVFCSNRAEAKISQKTTLLQAEFHRNGAETEISQKTALLQSKILSAFGALPKEQSHV